MQKKEGFFHKIAGFVFASSDPEAIKKRELKKIAKEINRQKFKWYKPSTGEALPQMGRFFCDIYATVGPAQGMLSNANSSEALKMIVVEESLSERQVKIKEGLSEERLKERAEKEEAKALESQVAKELESFQRDFTSEKTKNIDHIYSQVEEFSNFVMFDYYFMLKKFDPSIPEHDYSYAPRCDTIRSEYILDDLRDFAAVASGLPLNADWKTIFAMIKHYRGVEPAALNRWAKIVRSVAEVRKSNILPLIIRHIAKNPIEQVKPVTVTVRVVDAYILKLRTQTEAFLKKIVQETKTSKTSQLANKLFGTASPESLVNYTDESSENFRRRNFTGYTRATELNSLSAFLSMYLKTDITKINDLCFVRGQWVVQEDSTAFSNSYHALIDLSAKIKAFDDSLSVDAPLGIKLRALLARQERDREAKDQLKTHLKDVNRDALALLTEGAQNLVVIGKSLKMLITDHEKQHQRAILNWKEIESAAEKNISEMLSESYKKVYSIVMLLQVCLKGGSGKGS